MVNESFVINDGTQSSLKFAEHLPMISNDDNKYTFILKGELFTPVSCGTRDLAKCHL